MGNTTFDPLKLIALDGLDRDSALMKFGGLQSYFDGLNRFVEESSHYLQSYTPTVVIFDEKTRKDFLSDVKEIRSTLISLGMIHSAASLSDLDDAVKHNNADELSDTLQVFFSEMDIMARRISSALADDGDTPKKDGKK